MFLIAIFPWLAGLWMQEPYGYIFAVDMWYGICGFLMFPFLFAILAVDGFTEKAWQMIGLTAYFWIMNWIL